LSGSVPRWGDRAARPRSTSTRRQSGHHDQRAFPLREHARECGSKIGPYARNPGKVR
jgi:hypothetical protein